MSKRLTKKECFEIIKEMAIEDGNKEIYDFAVNQIKVIENKAARDRKKTIEKQKNDKIKDIVYSVLTENYRILDNIIDSIDDKNITKAMIVARLNKLVEEDLVEKEEIRIEGFQRKLVGYRRTTPIRN